MATLTELAEWTAGIYQLEEEDVVQGGPDGIDNVQAKQLANRTMFLKALLENFFASPVGPTAVPGTNTTQLATTAFVQAAAAALVASSPAALDTLNELAAALGNDANFAATITNALSLKAPLVSPALSGTPTAPTPALLDNTTKLATTAFVQQTIDEKLPNVSNFAKTLLDDPDVATARSTLGISVFGSTLVDDADAAQARSTLGAAPLASPMFTGTPAGPTAVAGTNTTQLATTAFVQVAAAALVASSPAALDTLNELAAALGNDANFAATITNALALKLNASAASALGLALIAAADAATARGTLGVPAGSGTSTGVNTGDQTASSVVFTPIGSLTATDVQGMGGQLSDQKIQKIILKVNGTDLNNLFLTTEFARVLGSWVNGPPGDIGNSIVEVIVASDVISQTVLTRDGRAFRRAVTTPAAFPNWQEIVQVVAESLGTNGYRKWSDGTIEQWGTTAGIGENVTSVITLPISYLSANNFVIPVATAGLNTSMQVIGAPGLSSFSLKNVGHGSGGGTSAAMWYSKGK